MPRHPASAGLFSTSWHGLLTLVLTCTCSLSSNTRVSAQQVPTATQGAVDSSGKFVPKGPTAEPVKTPALTREEAEAALHKELKIERIDAKKLKIGLVTLDQATRSVRFQATVNMTQGPVEYAVVTDTGKRHEAVFTTKASPRDIHLALLLLGIQPAAAKTGPGQKLQIPATAAINATVEWETNGPLATHPLAAMIALTTGDPSQATQRTLPDGPWLYLGSSFDASGFRALREGSIISLIGDEAALVNNPGNDRTNDDIHLPNAALLPKPGLPVTIVLTMPASR